MAVTPTQHVVVDGSDQAASRGAARVQNDLLFHIFEDASPRSLLAAHRGEVQISLSFVIVSCGEISVEEHIQRDEHAARS